MQIAAETVTIPKAEYEKLQADLAHFQYQLAELRRLVFGTRSERFLSSAPSGQLPLFQHAPPQEQPAPRPAKTITYQRSEPTEKQSPVRALLPAHLPRQEQVIEPDNLQAGMEKIGEQVTEILEHTPGKLYVRRIVRPKYAPTGQDGVSIAALPSVPIPKGNAGPGLLAHLQVSKWVDHLPYYRQIEMFKREGVPLAASTVNGWFKATCELLTPLYERLVAQVQQQAYLQADESPIRVQDRQKKQTTHLGYHWVYHAPVEKLVVFHYQPSRAREGPSAFLKDFQGYLQTDGYAAYNGMGTPTKPVTLLACMAHVRRYFEKALDNDAHNAQQALTTIQALYGIERQANQQQLDCAQRQQLRQQQALPILKLWKTQLEQLQRTATPKSPIGKAVNYTLSLWSRIIRYVEKGEYLIDNNLIENAIRPLALGRKNYLFAGSHQAAQQAAMMYSFFATCKRHQVNPYLWLKDVLEQIPDRKVNDLEDLLPQHWNTKQAQQQ